MINLEIFLTDRQSLMKLRSKIFLFQPHKYWFFLISERVVWKTFLYKDVFVIWYNRVYLNIKRILAHAHYLESYVFDKHFDNFLNQDNVLDSQFNLMKFRISNFYQKYNTLKYNMQTNIENDGYLLT